MLVLLGGLPTRCTPVNRSIIAAILVCLGLALCFANHARREVSREKNSARGAAGAVEGAEAKVARKPIPARFAAATAGHGPKSTSEAGLRAYLHLPLVFEPNEGQAVDGVKFVAHGPGYSLALGADQASLRIERSGPAGDKRDPKNWLSRVAKPGASALLGIQFVGAKRESTLVGLDEQGGRSNYFIGNDPSRWHRNIPQYARVMEQNVYPGTNVIFYGNPRPIEYDFQLAPGADPAQIRLALAGASAVYIEPTGRVRIATAAGNVWMQKPVVYQQLGAQRHNVKGGYRLLARNELTFFVGDYDHSKPLIIDPILTYAISGMTDAATSVTVDGQSNAYLAGYAVDSNFPTTPGALQTSGGGPSNYSYDGFVMKVNPAGSSLVYSTYFGGSSVDAASRIVLDGTNAVYATGITSSADFPVTSGSFQRHGP